MFGVQGKPGDGGRLRFHGGQLRADRLVTFPLSALLCTVSLAQVEPLQSHATRRYLWHSYVPSLTGEAPWWVYIVNALCLFIYQTMDAVDGKQARYLSLSHRIH